jgi:hypothetical protein
MLRMAGLAAKLALQYLAFGVPLCYLVLDAKQLHVISVNCASHVCAGTCSLSRDCADSDPCLSHSKDVFICSSSVNSWSQTFQDRARATRWHIE